MLFWCLFNLQMEKYIAQLTSVAVADVDDGSTEEAKRRLCTNPLKNLIALSSGYGHPLLQVASGWLGNRFSCKSVLAFSCSVVFSMTLVTACVVMYGQRVALIAARVISGLGHGFSLSPAHGSKKWSPPAERTFMTTLAYSGIIAAMFCSNLINGLLMQNIYCFSYIIMLYCCSMALWMISWSICIFDDPNSHPYITEEEKSFILDSQIISPIDKNHGTLPLKSIVRSLPIWALILAQCGHEFSFHIMQFMFPKFVNDVIGYDLDKNW
ncbi:sodium-dependent phosphate transport protein 1-like [Ctenocephalides felis]|uniref:sodium-dependent phosphate transport protein 1-like n=1 Tax=Ctenocephalides felis TaxID=7515 RepID=UPI000E6E120B|nr:sodium-dependent phosphate transport protein 1-like [Ctenocephalides felis]